MGSLSNMNFRVKIRGNGEFGTSGKIEKRQNGHIVQYVGSIDGVLA